MLLEDVVHLFLLIGRKAQLLGRLGIEPPSAALAGFERTERGRTSLAIPRWRISASAAGRLALRRRTLRRRTRLRDGNRDQ
jgi:hypothetical protein